jgi:hypothetical protein
VEGGTRYGQKGEISRQPRRHFGNVANWEWDLKQDCPRCNAPNLSQRCDLICPDLPKVL